MARPKNADATATRARILVAARSLFAEKGLRGTSTREIATAAEVSVATIHHHFGTKTALHEAASNTLWSGMGSVHLAFIHAIDDGDDLGTLVDKCVRVAFAYAREQRDGMRMLMRRLIERGGLANMSSDGGVEDKSAQDDLLVPFIRNAGTLLAAATGRRERRVRLELSSIVFLVVRYALADTEQIALLLDIDNDATNDDEMIAALEDHLVDVSLRILAIER